MQFIYQLLKLRFLLPRTLFLFFRAKKIHGNNICFLLKLAADRFSKKIALTDGIHALNFKELYVAVLNLSFLIQKKLKTEEPTVVILACGNTINHIIALYAIENLGIKLILVNHRAHINDINNIIRNQPKPCYLISSEPLHLSIEKSLNIDELISESSNGTNGKILSKSYSAVVFPTSGTTGNAKLIEKRTGAFYWLRTFTELIFYTGIYKRESVFISIPVSHGFGYTALMFALVLGKKAMLTNIKDQRIVAELLIKEHIDLIAGVPTSLFRLSENLKNKHHNIFLVISGGAPLNEVILQSISTNISTNIFGMYGSTEASSSFIASYSSLKKNIHTLGNPLKGVKYRLETLPGGGKELLIQSPLSNVTSNSWLHSGDLAEVDNEGNLIWRGRIDNMIIKGGINIYPSEIENILYKDAEIEDAFVMGQEDIEKGEIVIAYVKTKPDKIFNEEKIKNKLKLFLPGIKIPDRIYEVTDFEYTNTGKKVKPVLPALKQ